MRELDLHAVVLRVPIEAEGGLEPVESKGVCLNMVINAWITSRLSSAFTIGSVPCARSPLAIVTAIAIVAVNFISFRLRPG